MWVLKELTEIRDLPAPSKERFRDWFKRNKRRSGNERNHFSSRSILAHIQQQLGKSSSKPASIRRPAWKNRVNWETNEGLSKEELVEQLKMQCQQIHTRVVETTPKEAPSTLRLLMKEYGEGPVMTSSDRRFAQYECHPMFQALRKEGISVTSWNADTSREENIRQAEQAKYAVVFSDYTLAESGTVVLSSHQGQGRALHFYR